MPLRSSKHCIPLRSGLLLGLLFGPVLMGVSPRVWSAEPPAESSLSDSSYEALSGRLAHKISTMDWGGGTLSVYVADSRRRIPVLKRDVNLTTAPGGPLKILTAAAALDRLGPDFRFTTEASLLGSIEGRRLSGDLVVRSDGDPTLGFLRDPADPDTGYEMFDAWAKEIRGAGIRTIEGDIVLDISAFDHQRFALGWATQRLGDPAMPEISALNYNRNCIDVFWRPGKKDGTIARFDQYPLLDEAIHISNNVRLVDYETDSRQYSRRRGSQVLIFSGTLRLETAVHERVSIPAPPLFFGEALKSRLGEARIKVLGRVRLRRNGESKSSSADQRRTLATHDSEPLIDILRAMTRGSFDLDAEVILKTLGARKTGRPGSFADGAEVVMEFLRENQILSSGVVMLDGSGRSKFNRVSAAHFMGLMQWMRDDPKGRLLESLFPEVDPDGRSPAGPSRPSGFLPVGPGRMFALSGQSDRSMSRVGWASNGRNRPIEFAFVLADTDLSLSDFEVQTRALAQAIADSRIP